MPVHGIDNGNNKKDVYTTEEVLSILQQAIDSGTLQGIDPDETPIVAAVRESHNNSDVTFWSGTEAEFNELTGVTSELIGARIGSDGRLYLLTGDTTLSDTVEAARQAALEATEGMKREVISVTLLANAWSNTAPYTQTVTVPGMTADKDFLAPYVVPTGNESDDIAAQVALSCISGGTTDTDSVTFYCYDEKPTTTITVFMVDKGTKLESSYPVATTANLGMVKVGNGLSVGQDGTLSADAVESVAYAVDTVAEMIAGDFAEGDIVETAGYYSVGDGGAARYKIVQSGATVDGGSIIAINASLNAQLIIKDNIVSVKQFGAKGDGETDDHDAIQAAINSLTNGTVYFPSAKYIVGSSISCKQHVNLKGDFDYKYVGAANVGICFNNTDGFINGKTIKIDKLIVQNIGNSKIGAGIKGTSLNITDCMVSGFSVGIHGNYGQLFVNNCYIQSNNTGVTQIVDSRVTNTTINANDSNGIYLPEGANDNIIANNKIEWNGGRGIQTYKSYDNVISNNVIDRNAISGIEINSGSINTVVGNVLRRNCVNVSSTSVRHAQIVLESTNHVVLSANVLRKGNSQDDGSGDSVPQYAVYAMTSSNVLSIGNDYLDGGTETPLVNTYNNGDNVQFLDSGFALNKFLQGTSVTSSDVSSGTSQTLIVPGTAAYDNGLPQIDKFNYYIRRTDKGSYEAGEIDLSNFVLWGSSSSTSAKISKDSFMGGNVTAAISFNRETSQYSIVFSTTDTDHSYQIKLTPIYI